MADEEAPLDDVALSAMGSFVGVKDETENHGGLEESHVPTDPSISEGEASLREDKQECQLRNYRWSLVLFALFIAILVLGLALPLTLRKSTTSSSLSGDGTRHNKDFGLISNNPSGIPSNSPPTMASVPASPPPTLAPSAMTPNKPEQLLEALRQLLPDSLYQRLITDGSSNEFAAYELLLEDDDVGNDSDLLSLQRFIVTVWDVAMGANVFQRNVHECSWEGVSCDTNQSIHGIQWGDRQLSGRLPDVIFSNITSLDLGDNQLQADIPTAWYTDAPRLEYVYLHNNELTGSISTEIASWSQLRRLYLGGNQFTGTLPQALGSPGSNGVNARALEYLSLYDNNFRGTLPLNWNLRNLFYMDLGNNQLSGSIPTDWVEGRDRMGQLRVLYLDNNRFSGRLPAKLGEIGNARLNLLSISENSFSGNFPTFYNFTKKLNILELENSGLTGMDKKNCKHSVFESGELVRLLADCGMCPCKELCSDNLCNKR